MIKNILPIWEKKNSRNECESWTRDYHNSIKYGCDIKIQIFQVKPRSLRFTWSMKTTSSRDPNEIMAEIKKVGSEKI